MDDVPILVKDPASAVLFAAAVAVVASEVLSKAECMR